MVFPFHCSFYLLLKDFEQPWIRGFPHEIFFSSKEWSSNVAVSLLLVETSLLLSIYTRLKISAEFAAPSLNGLSSISASILKNSELFELILSK